MLRYDSKLENDAFDDCNFGKHKANVHMFVKRSSATTSQDDPKSFAKPPDITDVDHCVFQG